MEKSKVKTIELEVQKDINTAQRETNVNQKEINVDIGGILIRMDQRMGSLERLNIDHQDILKNNQEVMQEMISSLNTLISLTEGKVEKLIELITSKGLVPLPVFKWFAIFVLVFSFACFFGVQALPVIVSKFR